MRTATYPRVGLPPRAQAVLVLRLVGVVGLAWMVPDFVELLAAFVGWVPSIGRNFTGGIDLFGAIDSAVVQGWPGVETALEAVWTLILTVSYVVLVFARGRAFWSILRRFPR